MSLMLMSYQFRGSIFILIQVYLVSYRNPHIVDLFSLQPDLAEPYSRFSQFQDAVYLIVLSSYTLSLKNAVSNYSGFQNNIIIN